MLKDEMVKEKSTKENINVPYMPAANNLFCKNTTQKVYLLFGKCTSWSIIVFL